MSLIPRIIVLFTILQSIIIISYGAIITVSPHEDEVCKLI